MRIVNFLLAAMFLVFAFLQLNDPDPVIWILIYGTMAVFSIMAIFQRYPQRFLLAVFILFLAYSFVYIKGVQEWLRQENKAALFDNVAKMEHLYIEEAREFLGLMICLAVLGYYYYRSRKRIG
ncbi:MAG TPA: transmembrane 220 family protein [Chryseolinea sp.]|nr:transmembrane 220 family protein [Chryseolinea sp.]